MTTDTPAPQLRAGMTAAALRAEIAALESRIKYLRTPTVTCQHCAHFEAGAHCAVAQQQVPEDFQKTPDACPDWVWDEIPF